MPAAKKKEAVDDRKTSEMVDLEVEELTFRKPKRPIRSKFKEHAFSVVMLTWLKADYGDDPDKPADRDHEPFDDESDAREFFKFQAEWASEEVVAYQAAHADDEAGPEDEMWFATILVTDCDPDNLVLDTIEVHGGPKTWQAKVQKHLKENPGAIFSTTKKDDLKEKLGAVKKAKHDNDGVEPGEVVPKARKKSAAAPVAAGPAKEYTDDELAEMSIEEIDRLPRALKGKALALHSKRRRAEAAAKKAQAAALEPEPEAPAPRPTAKKRVARKVEAKKAPAKRVSASEFVKA